MSAIFQPFRAVGVVSGDVPFSLNTLGSQKFVTVPVGNSFHVYNCADLRLALVSSLVDRPITACCNVNEVTFTASGSSLLVWHRAHIVQRLSGEHSANIDSLLSFGPTVVSVSSKDSRVCAWNVVQRDGSNVQLVTSFRLDVLEENSSDDSDDGEDSEDNDNDDSDGSQSGKTSRRYRDESFVVTSVLHPATYINKVVFGSAAGKLELWNVATRKHVHTMQCVNVLSHSESNSSSSSSQQSRGAVTAMAQSPAADIVGVGYSTGEIYIVNLAYDNILMQFNQREGLGCVTSLSFRTDSAITSTSGTNTARLVSTGETGHFAVWDLQNKRLETMYHDAHDGRIVSAVFMPKEPLLLTSGEDNSLRMFIFDQPDGSARQLKSRIGHWMPPTKIRFYGGEVLTTLGDGADGAALQIISSGLDRSVRSFHVVRDAQSRELSQGKVNAQARRLGQGVKAHTLKLNPVLHFVTKETRGRDWCDIISCHEGSTSARVWSFENKRLGEHVLTPSNVVHHYTTHTLSKKRKKNASSLRPSMSSSSTGTSSFTITTVGLSTCGNYGLVGDSRGIVHRYNMQSGQARGTYPKAKSVNSMKFNKKIQNKKRKKGNNGGDDENFLKDGQHDGSITSIHTDPLNEIMTTTGLDGCLKVWDFRSHLLQHSIQLGSPIGSAHLSSNGLLTCACDDFVLRVYDVSSKTLDTNIIVEPRRVRIFRGHTGRITEMCMTPDGRWLITSSTDSTVRVWDIPTARCVDWFSFEDAVTSMSLSPSGEFLATTHVEQNGIYIWANRAHFGNVMLNSQNIGVEPKRIQMPIPKVHRRDDRAEALQEQEDERIQQRRREETERIRREAADSIPTKPLETGLVTMSGIAKSKFETLPKLDIIKERNKPMEPPKVPEKAPFFLGQLEGITADGSGPSLFEHSNIAKKVGFEKDGSLNSDNNDNQKAEGSHLLRLGRHGAEMSLVGLLKRIKQREQMTLEQAKYVVEYLMTLSASGVDIQLNSLSMGEEDLAGKKHLKSMLRVFELIVKSNENFDAVQAYLHRFCFVHGDTIAACEDLLEATNDVRLAQNESWGKVQRLLQETSCLVKLFTKAH